MPVYNQYVAGDLIYSRIYETDPPQSAAPTAAAEAISVKAEIAAPKRAAAQAATAPAAEKNAGSTGILGQLGLEGLGGEALPLLLLLLLLLQKGKKPLGAPALMGLLLLGLGKEAH